MDKKLRQLLVLTAVIVALPGAAIAAPKSKTSSGKSADQISTGQSQVTTERYQSAYPQWGLGIASADNVIRMASAASFWLAFNQDSALQGYFGISGTSPFLFGVGALYKHTIAGGNYAGLHIGGGLGLGTASVNNASVFAMNIDGVLGFHFFLPSLKNILINVDLGPVVAITDGSAEFGITGLGALLGLSIHYIF